VPAGADLAGDVHESGGDHRLHGHPCAAVLGQQVVEDGVGDLVADLVGVPFGDRFGREGAQLAGGHGAQGTSGREGRRASRTAWATRVLEPSARASSSPLRSRIRTELSAAPNTPPVMSLKISRSAPLRRAFCCASSRAPTPSAPVSAAKPTIAGRVAPLSVRSSTL